jgi:hypothetical protein
MGAGPGVTPEPVLSVDIYRRRPVPLWGARGYEQAAAEQVEELRVQLSRAEDFAAMLRARLPESEPVCL